MHSHTVFHVILHHTTVTFLSMDEALAFVKDMSTRDFVLCASNISKAEYDRLVGYIKEQTIK